MRKPQGVPIENRVDYSYEGRPLPPNLLDYRYMDIYMSRQADTGKISCLGTLVMAIMLLSCGFGISMLLVWIR